MVYSAWRLFGTLLSELLNTKPESVKEKELNILLDAVVLNRPTILKEHGYTVVIHNGSSKYGKVIYSLRELEIGIAYVTEKETCLMRSTKEIVEIGDYFSSPKKGGYICIPVPQNPEEEIEIIKDSTQKPSMKGDLLPDVLLFAIEKFTQKKINDGMNFYELARTQIPLCLRFIKSLDEFSPNTTYVSVDNYLKLRRQSTGRFMFKFSRNADILPIELISSTLHQIEAKYQTLQTIPRKKLLPVPKNVQNNNIGLTSPRSTVNNNNLNNNKKRAITVISNDQSSKENTQNGSLSKSPLKKQKIENDQIEISENKVDEKTIIELNNFDQGVKNIPIPPPPPPLSSSIPKPPPPPSSLQFTSNNENLTPTKKKKKMRPLRWSAIPNHKINSTIWGNSSPSSPTSSPSRLFSETEIESLFSLSPNQNNKKTSSTSLRIGSKTLLKTSSLLPIKRSNNISIVLARLNIDQNIRNSILFLGNSELSLDQLISIRSILPITEEEHKLILQSGDFQSLNRAEKFVLEIGNIDHLTEIVDCLIFREQVDEILNEISSSINTIHSACNEIKNSQKLPKLLKVILAVGSVLNRDTYLSSKGFKLESLRSISETMDKSGKLTLLHYLSKIICEKSPELLHFLDELPHCHPATHCTIEKVLLDFKSLSHYFITLKTLLPSLEKISGENDQFSQITLHLRTLFQNINERVTTINSAISHLQQLYLEVCMYFGEDNGTRYNSGEFFGVIYQFSQSLNKAQKDNAIQKTLQNIIASTLSKCEEESSIVAITDVENNNEVLITQEVI